jgi:monoamine oxidase
MGLATIAMAPKLANTQPSDPDLIIVKAGIAGLLAARTLRATGRSKALL